MSWDERHPFLSSLQNQELPFSAPSSHHRLSLFLGSRIVSFQVMSRPPFLSYFLIDLLCCPHLFSSSLYTERNGRSEKGGRNEFDAKKRVRRALIGWEGGEREKTASARKWFSSRELWPGYSSRLEQWEKAKGSWDWGMLQKRANIALTPSEKFQTGHNSRSLAFSPMFSSNMNRCLNLN